MGPQFDPLTEAFKPLIGLPAWFVRKGQGSFLTLEFGKPHLRIREPIEASPEASERVRRSLARRHVAPAGEWHLWIYCCHWVVLSGEAEISSSESSDRKIRSAVQELDGQRLVAVAVDPTKGTSAFRFDLGVSIQTQPDGHDIDEQWMLYMKSGDVFTYRSDGCFALGPGTASSDELVWRPLPACTVG
jgi:hypothetical protein